MLASHIPKFIQKQSQWNTKPNVNTADDADDATRNKSTLLPSARLQWFLVQLKICWAVPSSNSSSACCENLNSAAFLVYLQSHLTPVSSSLTTIWSLMEVIFSAFSKYSSRKTCMLQWFNGRYRLKLNSARGFKNGEEWYFSLRIFLQSTFKWES